MEEAGADRAGARTALRRRGPGPDEEGAGASRPRCEEGRYAGRGKADLEQGAPALEVEVAVASKEAGRRDALRIEQSPSLASGKEEEAADSRE